MLLVKFGSMSVCSMMSSTGAMRASTQDAGMQYCQEAIYSAQPSPYFASIFGD